jgi:hypothetical protein
VVSAWTKGGNVPDATVRLQATPAGVTPQFSFGCGSSNGTASCDLGAMDAKSAERQLQAESMVPATASTVKSVRLTVIGSAASLPKDPKAFATVAIKGSASVTQPTPTISPLPVGALPGVPTTNPTIGATLSPGGNASGLFPTLKPSPSSNSNSKAALNAKARQAADTSALPEGGSVVGAQLAGLAALLVAFVLAVTRFSIRRRPAPATADPAAEAMAAPAAKPTAAQAKDSGPTDAASKSGESAESAQDPAGPSGEDGKSSTEA